MTDQAPTARPHRGRARPTADRDAAAAMLVAGPEFDRAGDEPSNERWRALLAEGGPILADGAMGTMLFANGLQFGDPPEVWNVSHPEVILRIQRGYLEAGSRIVMTNTFGGNRLRLQLHGLEDRVDELNRTAAIILRAEVEAAGGRALLARDIRPDRRSLAPLRALSDEEAGRD